MQNFDYSKSLTTESAEVLVIGGGPSGLCAAVAASRAGANVTLIEQNGFCGGMATAGLVAPFMTCYDSGGSTMLIRGLFEEIVDRLVEMGGAIHPSKVETSSAFTSYITVGHIHVTPFKAEDLKLLADRMLKEANVNVLYHTSFVLSILFFYFFAKIFFYFFGTFFEKAIDILKKRSII
jgi:NADPH-dependent 2,4-dienoyl-CoA reductase/sulfur reductase-like enzyme